MKAHLIDTHLLVPRSRSSAKVKVKYQGHVAQNMGVLGALVFHKYILFFLYLWMTPFSAMVDYTDNDTGTKQDYQLILYHTISTFNDPE